MDRPTSDRRSTAGGRARAAAGDARLAPENAPLQHRLGLLFHLLDRPEDSERALARATELEPNEAHFHWVLAVFLEQRMKREAALHHAQAVLALWPKDEQYLATVERLRQP